MNEKSKISCLFVHGWGMNHAIWQPVLDKLPDWIDASVMDLPGHGQRHIESFDSLQSLTDDLLNHCKAHKKNNQPLMLVGWSLGALPCIQRVVDDANLNESSTVDALMMVSTNPCFVTVDDWKCGIDAKVFDQFSESLKTDFSGTIRRFLSLQVKGSESGRVILRGLRDKVLQQAQPDVASLDAGLQILKQVDLRNQLKQVQQPTCWALGSQDGLVGRELAEELNILMPRATVNVYDKAGHAPFLSHTDEFVQQLINFAQSLTLK